MKAATARFLIVAVMVSLLPATVAIADSGLDLQSSTTLALQKALKEKGFYRGPLDGVNGYTTQHAVMAFRKEIGAGRSYSWSSSLWDDLEIYQAPYTRFTEPDRVEINLTKQTAHLFRGGDLVGTFDISSGNGESYVANGVNKVAITPTGNFSVYRRVTGWYESTLGLGSMLNPWFFVGGIALHGSNNVPPYPASHGCIRLTISDSGFISKHLYIGIPVHVFRSGEGPVYGSDGPFADVPASHFAAGAIGWMLDQGHTQGCRPYFYCPGTPATRGEIAVFMKRVLEPYLGPAPAAGFADTAGHPYESAINWIAGHGITVGCNPPSYSNFCPDRSVTRGEMSALFKRAVDHLIEVDPAMLDPDHFADTQGSLFVNSIAWLAASGITSGCNPPTNTAFCPTQKVTRAELAVFLKRVADRL